MIRIETIISFGIGLGFAAAALAGEPRGEVPKEVQTRVEQLHELRKQNYQATFEHFLPAILENAGRASALSVEDEAAELCRMAARDDNWTASDLAEFKEYRKKRREEAKKQEERLRSEAYQVTAQAFSNFVAQFPEARAFFQEQKDAKLELPVGYTPFDRAYYLYTQGQEFRRNRGRFHQSSPYSYSGLSPYQAAVNDVLETIEKAYNDEFQAIIKQTGFDLESTIKAFNDGDRYSSLSYIFNSAYEKNQSPSRK